MIPFIIQLMLKNNFYLTSVRSGTALHLVMESKELSRFEKRYKKALTVNEIVRFFCIVSAVSLIVQIFVYG